MSFHVSSSHSGAEFEAGQLGHRNGEAPNGEARVDDAAKMPALGSTKAVCDCVCAKGAVLSAVARARSRRAHGVSGLACMNTRINTSYSGPSEYE